MTPINHGLFCGPYYITCGNFATTCCAQRSPLDSSSIHVLGGRSPILTCSMTRFVLWPMKTLPSPRLQRSMKILAFPMTPFGLRKSLPSSRPLRSVKIPAFSKTPSVYEDPDPVSEILLIPGPSVHLPDSPSFINIPKYSLTGLQLIFPTVT